MGQGLSALIEDIGIKSACSRIFRIFGRMFDNTVDYRVLRHDIYGRLIELPN